MDKAHGEATAQGSDDKAFRVFGDTNDQLQHAAP